MTFDISSYELEDTATFTPKNLKGDDDLIGSDGLPVVFEVFSPGSATGVKALHKAGKSSQMRMWRAMRGEFDKNDAESADREWAQKLADFTKSISPNFPIDPLSLYSNPKLVWIGKQVEEFVGKYANFSARPSVG